MTTDQTTTRPPRWRRPVRTMLVALLAVVCTLALALAALPPILSSTWMRQRVQTALAEATHLPTSLNNLRFSWGDGLLLEGLNVGTGGLDSPEFLCSLERLELRPQVVSLWSKAFGLRVTLEGLSLRHELSPTPPTPPQDTPATPLPQALKDALSQLRQLAKPTPQAFDLQADVTMRNINLRVLTPGSASALDIRDLALSISVPSLRAGALTAQAGFTPKANGTALAPVAFQAKVTELASAQGELQPLRAMFDCTAKAPGLVASITGSVHKGLKADLRLQLAQLLTPLRPLLPPATPALTGALAFSATATMPETAASAEHSAPTVAAGTGGILRLGLLVFADDVTATGGSLGAKSAGPLRLSLLQEAKVDLATGSAEIPGTLTLGGTGQLSWTGQVTGILESQPTLALNVKDADLPLRPVLVAVRDFLPPGLSIGDAQLNVEQLGILAKLTDQASGTSSFEPIGLSNMDISLTGRGIAFGAQRCALAQGKGKGKESLALGSLRVSLDVLDATLPAAEPAHNAGTLTATASAQATDLRKKSASPLALRSATLGALRINATELRHDPAALFGVSGKLTLEKTATLTGLDLGGALKADTITQAVALSATMPASKAISANLSELRVEIPVLRAVQKGKRPLEVPVLLVFKAPDLRLTQDASQTPAPLIPAVTGASLELSLGKALRTSANFTLGGAGGRELATTGNLSLDAGQLATLAATLLPRTAKISGVAGADWNAAVVLPQAGGHKAAPPSGKQRLQDLKALRRLVASLSLGSISVDWPQKNQDGSPAEPLRLRGLTTPKPLRLTTTNGAEDSTLAGTVAFGPLASLPGVGPLAKPVSGLLTLNAAQQGARSVQLSQMLRLDGFGLEQNLSLNMDKLDALLDMENAAAHTEAQADTLTALLQRANGSLSFSLRTGLDALPPRAEKTISGKGRVEVGAEAKLIGGRSLAVSGRFLTPGMDLRLGPAMAITGLHSNLALHKRYALGFGPNCGSAALVESKPLSEYVFDQLPAAQSLSPSPESFALRSLYSQQDTRSAGSFGFSQLVLRSGPLPLAVSDMNLRLDTSGPLPLVRSFRLGLFGGNILGSAALRGGLGRYSLETDFAFTGLDAAQMLSGRGAQDFGDQAETSGRISLKMPLTADADALLRQLKLRADITKVGPRTLERMLYALDPDEQNETIVQQRRLMGIGYPRNVRLNIDYGNLSLSGQVEVKGFRLDLPAIDRLAVGNLPVRAQLDPALAKMPRLIDMLDMLSAAQLCRSTTRSDSPQPLGAQLRLTTPPAKKGATP